MEQREELRLRAVDNEGEAAEVGVDGRSGRLGGSTEQFEHPVFRTGLTQVFQAASSVTQAVERFDNGREELGPRSEELGVRAEDSTESVDGMSDTGEGAIVRGLPQLRHIQVDRLKEFRAAGEMVGDEARARQAASLDDAREGCPESPCSASCPMAASMICVRRSRTSDFVCMNKVLV